MDPKQDYTTPGMVEAGPAAELTRGGYENDYDQPGVRKTKKNYLPRQGSRHQASRGKLDSLPAVTT